MTLNATVSPSTAGRDLTLDSTMSPRLIARATGLLYLLTIVGGIFARIRE
jgi:hypothetical protein